MQPEEHSEDTTRPGDPDEVLDGGEAAPEVRSVFGCGTESTAGLSTGPLADSPSPLPFHGVTGLDYASPVGADVAEASAVKPKQDSLLEVAVVVLLALVLALLLKTYVAEAYMIRGSSMEPTFRDGQRVMVQKAFFEVERGDVIIFASKDDPRKDLIKRVIALPGESVEVIDGHPYVDDKRFHESYITEFDKHRGQRYGPRLIPNNQFFVLGDNRPESQDSRTFGAVESSLIKGKVILRWWPFEELRSF
jgi:signal peptidase I